MITSVLTLADDLPMITTWSQAFAYAVIAICITIGVLGFLWFISRF